MRASPSSELGRPQVTFKTVFVVATGTLLVALVVWGLARARVALALTGISALLAVALDHVIERLERWRLKRGLAIALTLVAVLLFIVALALIVVPAAVTQAKGLIKAAPHLVEGLRASPSFQKVDNMFHIKEDFDDPGAKIANLLRQQAAPVLSLVGGFLALVSGALVVLFLTVFMLVFGGDLIRRAVAEARHERRGLYEAMLGKIHHTLGGYVLGLGVICSVNAVLTTTFLAINHTPFFLPLGILSGFSSLVPYAGPLVAGVSISAITLGTGGVGHGIAAGIYFILYGQFEGNVLGPLVFRKTVRANPLLVTLSILFFAQMGGVVGAIAAVPVMAILQIVIGELLEVRRKRLKQAPLPASLAATP